MNPRSTGASAQRGFSVWKVSIAFIIFSALALYVMMKGGASLDMSGEKHGIETHTPAAASAPAPAAAPASAAEAGVAPSVSQPATAAASAASK